jgi:hypothetical protein
VSWLLNPFKEEERSMYPWNQPPTSGVVYIPTPAPPASGGFDIDAITRQIAGLEALKKLMKEEKKEDKKDDKDKDKKKELSVPSVMLLMILLSPVTGPMMSRFFQWGLASLPH